MKERVRRLEFKLADAESWNDKMSEAVAWCRFCRPRQVSLEASLRCADSLSS